MCIGTFKRKESLAAHGCARKATVTNMRTIRIGIFGAGRGVDLAKNFSMLGCEVVALCDFRPDRLETGAKGLGSDVALFHDFEAFLDYGLDAVIIANYFHEHAPYAIRCFERDIHVFSECISNGTMAEGIELYDAFQKSRSIYMLAENYPQMIFNREMKRICDGGTLGQILYAEGEYNHPVDPGDANFVQQYKYFSEHWRYSLPGTYYITHSLGPIMWATGATPRRVTAFNTIPNASQIGHGGSSIIMTQNDDGSVFRVTGCASFGGHHNAYRICGENGQVENLRGMGHQMMLRYNPWSKPDGIEETRVYEPSWNDPDEERILQSRHGGGDYLTARMFVECIKAGQQPGHPFDLKSAIAMSSCAILGYRSAMNSGMPYDIPDFDNEADRERYRHDRYSPFVNTDGLTQTEPVL